MCGEAHSASPRDKSGRIGLFGQAGGVLALRVGVAAEHFAVLERHRAAGGQLERAGAVARVLSAADNPLSVILNVGDRVTISHAESQEQAAILDGYSLTVEGRAQAQVTLPQDPPQETEPPAAAEEIPAA